MLKKQEKSPSGDWGTEPSHSAVEVLSGLEWESVWHSQPRMLEDTQKAVQLCQSRVALETETLPHHVNDSIFHLQPLTQQKV